MNPQKVDMRLEGNIQFPRLSDTVECFIQYITEDIKDAIVIVSDLCVRVGETIFLSIFLPPEMSEVKCTGRVVSRSEGEGVLKGRRGYLARIIIDEISHIDRRRLQRFIARRKAFIGWDRSVQSGGNSEAVKQSGKAQSNITSPKTEALKKGSVQGQNISKQNIHKENILLVDDEIINLHALKRTFRREYNVLTATNGEEALSIMDKNKIAIIITDQRMPGMTGVELLEKSIEKHPNAIRIILTAYPDQKLFLEAINKVHVHGFINKPWEPEEVISAIKDGYQRRNIFTPSALMQCAEEPLLA